VREGLLRYLPGYQGPDINARGLDVEGHAFFYINELESILREWVATVYRHRRHDSLFDPGLPAARVTPAQMFSHGIARAGYIEVPRDPQLAYEFLKVEPRTIQPKGVKWRNLVYKGDVLTELGKMKSPYERKFKDRWPIHIDPDDISRVYIRHRETREWHELAWEHASNVPVDHTSGQGNVHVIAPEVAGVDFDGVAEPNSSDGEVLEPNRDQLCR
jgi:hypothetical protein